MTVSTGTRSNWCFWFILLIIFSSLFYFAESIDPFTCSYKHVVQGSLMVKALASSTKECRFKSCPCNFLSWLQNSRYINYQRFLIIFYAIEQSLWFSEERKHNSIQFPIDERFYSIESKKRKNLQWFSDF